MNAKFFCVDSVAKEAMVHTAGEWKTSSSRNKGDAAIVWWQSRG